MKGIIVPYERYTDCTRIIRICMGTFCIVATSPSLIDITSLSHDEVVSDISPSFCLRVIEVDSTKESLIICILHKVFCSMMDDDTIDFFRMFYRPSEFMDTIIAFYRLEHVCIWIETCKRIILFIRFLSYFIFSWSLFYDEWSLSSYDPLIDTFRTSRLRDIPERLIRSPL